MEKKAKSKLVAKIQAKKAKIIPKEEETEAIAPSKSEEKVEEPKIDSEKNDSELAKESKTEIIEDPVEEELFDDGDHTFESLGLISQLVEATKEMGYKKPTKIQVQAIPWALKGRDIIGLAQTGSGKTAAYGLPILQHLIKEPSPIFACILCPTRYFNLLKFDNLRELAFQISKHLTALGSVVGVKAAVIVGGMGKNFFLR
jgi:ATP-dependent RNA helicase DDX47/RRP3